MNASPNRLFPFALALTLAACGGGRRTTEVVVVDPPRPVSIEVEVYDPSTNFVWENVSVRVVESYQEWSRCTCVSPFEDWFLTDANGRVYLDEFVLADAEVGFLEDNAGGALLEPGSRADEATVLLEVAAEGFVSVFVEVPLRWSRPDVFVEVPFQ